MMRWIQFSCVRGKVDVSCVRGKVGAHFIVPDHLSYMFMKIVQNLWQILYDYITFHRPGCLAFHHMPCSARRRHRAAVTHRPGMGKLPCVGETGPVQAVRTAKCR